MSVILRQDWYVVATVDITAPGSYEILIQGSGTGAGVRRVGDVTGEPLVVDPTGIAHPCMPCSCCAACACGHAFDGRALCGACMQYASWVTEMRPRLERYLEAIGRTDAFVETGGRTHVVGCSALRGNISTAAGAVEAGCTHRPEWFVRVPELCDAGTPRRRRCAVCCPDVVVQAGSGPVRGAKGRFVARP